MKLRFAAIALSATLVACGGGSGDTDSDVDADGVPLIGGGIDPTDSDVGETIDFEEDNVIDLTDTFADGCEGGSGTDIDSSTSRWDDNCRLQVGGEHQISSYTQGVQRIVFCRNPDSDIANIGAFADGNFGPMTREEVRRFQTAEGIGADGIVGPETWGALQDVLELLGVNEDDGSDAHGVALPGNCANVVQFYQQRSGTQLTGWTMARTIGSNESVPFSVGPPVQ